MADPVGSVDRGSTSPAWLTIPSLWPALLLVACTLLPYAGTWGFGFVDYDDPLAIVRFEPIRDLSLSRALALFRPDVYPGLPEYMPLKNLSYALDHALFGLWAPGYRIQQHLWYAAGVLLLWRWLRALLGAIAARGGLGVVGSRPEALAWITAALFALHPVHVESVTWLSGRKDVLSGAFVAWALWSAWRWDPAPGRRVPWACFAATALALLSKPTAVVLPALVLLADVMATERGTALARLRRRWVLHTGVAALALGFAAFYQRMVGPLASESLDAWRQNGGPAFARWGQQLGAFAGLSLAPLRLAPVLPPDLLDPSAASPGAGLGYAVLALVVVGGGVLAWRRHVLGLAAGLFALPLAPVLISPAWGQFVAPRYLHLAVAGPLLALAWCATWVAARRPAVLRPVQLLGAIVALALLATTIGYGGRWRDGLTLWLGSIEVFPRFTMYHERAARLALDAGQVDLGTRLLDECLRVEPAQAGCSSMRAATLVRDDPEKAERLVRAALRDDPTGRAHLELARLLARRGLGAEGFDLYLGWLRDKPLGVAQVEPLAWLALDLGDAERALFAVRHAIGAGARNEPAGSPPPELLLRLAACPGTDPQLAAAIRAALARCRRYDCLQQALGW